MSIVNDVKMKEATATTGTDPKPGYVRIKEGTAIMDYDEKEAVFYNKVQVFNRDISIQVIRLFAEQREKEKVDKHEARLSKYLAVHREQIAKTASIQGEPYDTSIDVSRVKLLEKSLSGQNNLGVHVECYRDPETEKEFRAPFAPPEGVHILDALAATGLRSIRYLKEIPGVRMVTINDLIPEATAAARENCVVNGVQVFDDNGLLGARGSKRLEDIQQSQKRGPGVRIHNGDAVAFMYAHKDAALGEAFDVIDLDPYGTAAPFLDSAVQAVADGGLLCVTCTDMAVLSGNFPEKCFSLYGTVGLKAKYFHEAALRTLLHSIDSAANRHKRHIVPWLCLSVDFYIRVFVRVFESPVDVKRSMLRRAMVLQSSQCESFYLQPMGALHPTKNTNAELFTGAHAQAPTTCPETGGAMKLGGPYWSAPIHDQNVVDELLRRVVYGDPTGETKCPLLPYPVTTAPRIKAVLSAISGELKDVPFYYTVSDLSASVHSRAVPLDHFRNALNNAGYRYSQFHHEPTSIKTDAPPQVIWDIMRAFCKLYPPQGSKHKAQSRTAQSILGRDIVTPIDFTLHSDNKFIGNDQGIADTPDNAQSVSYSLTHRHSPRNKVCAGVKSGQVAAVTNGIAGDVEVALVEGEEYGVGRDMLRGPRFPMNPEKNWGPKRKAGRQQEVVTEGDDSATARRGGQGVAKGRGAEFYIEQNKERAALLRAQRAAAKSLSLEGQGVTEAASATAVEVASQPVKKARME